MKACDMSYTEKVVALALLNSFRKGDLSKYTAIQTLSCSIGKKLGECATVLDELAANHRLTDSEVYYFDGETMYLQNADRLIKVTQAFFDSCSPGKQALLKKVRASFK